MAFRPKQLFIRSNWHQYHFEWNHIHVYGRSHTRVTWYRIHQCHLATCSACCSVIFITCYFSVVPGTILDSYDSYLGMVLNKKLGQQNKHLHCDKWISLKILVSDNSTTSVDSSFVLSFTASASLSPFIWWHFFQFFSAYFGYLITLLINFYVIKLINNYYSQHL